jgi:hypothetical protein
MQGDWKEDLQPGMVEQFDEVYNEVKQWWYDIKRTNRSTRLEGYYNW